MKISNGIFALAVVFAPGAIATSASAAGTVNLPAVEIEPLTIDVHGCHRGVRGNRFPHFHRGSSCRTVRVERDDDDDDDDDDDFDRDDRDDGEACLQVGAVTLCN